MNNKVKSEVQSMAEDRSWIISASARGLWMHRPSVHPEYGVAQSIPPEQ